MTACWLEEDSEFLSAHLLISMNVHKSSKTEQEHETRKSTNDKIPQKGSNFLCCNQHDIKVMRSIFLNRQLQKR